MKTSRACLALLALSALAVTAVAQDKAQLKLKLDEGKAVKYEATANMVMTISGEMLPSEQEMKLDIKMVQSLMPGALKEGWQLFKLTFDKLDVKFDSPMPMPTDPGEEVKKLEGSGLEGEVDIRGQVRKVKSFSKQKPEGMMQGMLSQITSGVTQGGLLGMTLPETEVGVGTKWEVKIDTSKLPVQEDNPMAGKSTGIIPVKFEVVAFEKLDTFDAVKVKYSADGDTVTKTSMMGQDLEVKSTSKTAGFMWIDVNNGQVIKAEATVSSISDMGQMKIATKVVSKTIRKA